MLADMPSCLLLTEIASSIYLRKTSSYLLRLIPPGKWGCVLADMTTWPLTDIKARHCLTDQKIDMTEIASYIYLRKTSSYPLTPIPPGQGGGVLADTSTWPLTDIKARHSTTDQYIQTDIVLNFVVVKIVNLCRHINIFTMRPRELLVVGVTY
jgi:hypothetical protein